MNNRLIYPTNNRALRFFGDVMIMVGSWILNVGMRYGGMYEYKFEDDDV